MALEPNPKLSNKNPPPRPDLPPPAPFKISDADLDHSGGLSDAVPIPQGHGSQGSPQEPPEEPVSGRAFDPRIEEPSDVLRQSPPSPGKASGEKPKIRRDPAPGEPILW